MIRLVHPLQLPGHGATAVVERKDYLEAEQLHCRTWG